MRRRHRRQEVRTLARGHALLGAQDVFQQERHAGERTLHRQLRGGAGAVEGLEDDGVDLRIVPLDAGDRFLDKFGRRDVALGDQISQPQRVEFRIVLECHSFKSLWFVRVAAHRD